MEALLPTDASVSVSFIIDGAVPNDLPEFIQVQPPRMAKTKRPTTLPFYQREAIQLPDSLSRAIMRTNRFALSSVCVREKLHRNGASCSVLKFLFGDASANIDGELHSNGLYLLEQMLRMSWRKIFIFRQASEDLQTKVNISIGKNVLVPDGAVFTDPDLWGIRTLH